jgi:hypothetical protein
MDILCVLPKSAWKKPIMPLKGKDLDANTRKEAQVSTFIKKPNKRRKPGKLDIFTLNPQLTSWYSGSGRAIKVKATEKEDKDKEEELQTPKAKISVASKEEKTKQSHRKHKKWVFPRAKKGR